MRSEKCRVLRTAIINGYRKDKFTVLNFYKQKIVYYFVNCCLRSY